MNGETILSSSRISKMSKFWEWKQPVIIRLPGTQRMNWTEPEAKKTYVFGAACDYTYIGIGPETFDSIATGGGQAFGNNGVRVKASESFVNTTNGFVLTEWEDFYSMDTISNCKKKITNAS